MKKSFILFAALAALFSCTKENAVSPETSSQETYSVTLTAVAPTTGDDTKTTLVEGGKFVHWSKGDAIKVMFAAQPIQEALMNTSDEFDSPGQVLNSYFEEETANEARFQISNFVLNASNKKLYKQKGIALYPETATAKSNKPKGYDPTTTVYYSLPKEQTAVKDNIESDLNLSYAVIDIYEFTSGSVPELQFYNACSLIKLTMPQSFNDKNIISVTIESNDGKYLSGKGTVDFNKFPDQFKISVAGDSREPGVTLKSETGFEPGATYYAVVWPGDHSGLTFTFTADDGATAIVPTSKAVSLQASHVKPYTFNSALQFEEEESWVYYAPGEGTGKYYYSNGTVGDNPAPTDRTILGVVFYNDNPRINDTALPPHCTHGLAIRVKNKSGVQWSLTSPLPNANFANHSKLYNVGEDWGYSVKIGWEDTYPGLDLNLYSTDYSIDSCDLPDGKTSGWYHATGKEWEIIKNDKDNINANLALCNGDATYQTNVKVWYPIMYNRSGQWKAYYFYDSGSWGIIEDKQNINNASNNARPIFAF